MPNPPRDPNELLTRSLSPDDLPDPRASLELLGLAQAGDRAALEELVTRYQDRLQRIVRIQLAGSFLRRDLDSMDVVQNTFRAALPKIRDLRPDSAASLLHWLSLIATNQIRDAHSYQRAQKRDPAREVRLDADTSSRAAPAPTAGSSHDPGRRALLNEVRELLDEQVAQLADDQRRVVVLRDYCGEDWERVAAELTRDVNATRQLHQRAWIKLRRALAPKLRREE